MKLNKVHHIAVICSDYGRSKAFYVDVLGLTVLNEIYRGERDSYKLDLALDGDYILELFSFPEPPARASYPEAAGLRHLAFEVDDVVAAVQELAESGVAAEPIRIDPVTGKRFTFLADPDGLPIELYGR
ncbi:lyase [Paenibacillus darwinianus]|uniref:Lyase n=1 Tax=Paenibacillus darwinianus TaxID=1380763 RepID=A0A9W5S1G5_9BACL|nr:VOC family protein [Paenibacillus darwinianus]EXX87395.1 lyase [Paenibacillus darwinianus]EXX88093.1 lyase [Paenibacillus darwinianus]EXX88682.1 lyase [Paenibacillus darwinianus]